MVIWRGMVKMTFTIDEATAETLRRISKRVNQPQSAVLREAIRHYEPHAGQLSIEERKKRVELFDQVLARIPKRPASEVDDELREIRRSRRQGWRRKTPRRG
jgi:predicted transcriptional regulator